MPENEQNSQEQENDEIKVTTEMVEKLVEEILKLEQENLYAPAPRIKEKIISLVKTRIR